MKVLICGGRDYADAVTMTRLLDKYHRQAKFTEVIHGGARGADTLAGQWAASRGIPVTVFPADWEKYGRIAGHIRNNQMLREGKPALVIAFPGNRGTANMIAIAGASRTPYYEVRG